MSVISSTVDQFVSVVLVSVVLVVFPVSLYLSSVRQRSPTPGPRTGTGPHRKNK